MGKRFKKNRERNKKQKRIKNQTDPASLLSGSMLKNTKELKKLYGELDKQQFNPTHGYPDWARVDPFKERKLRVQFEIEQNNFRTVKRLNILILIFAIGVIITILFKFIY